MLARAAPRSAGRWLLRYQRRAPGYQYACGEAGRCQTCAPLPEGANGETLTWVPDLAAEAAAAEWPMEAMLAEVQAEPTRASEPEPEPEPIVEPEPEPVLAAAAEPEPEPIVE